MNQKLIEKKHPVKIILIEHLNEIGGSSRVSISLVKGLSDKFDFHVIIPDGEYLKEFEEAGAKVYKMSLNSFRPSLIPNQFFNQIKLIFEIRNCVKGIVKKNEPTIIHINTLPNIIPAIATRLLGLPTIWHIHETKFNPIWLFRLLTWFACSISGSVIAVSNSSAQALTNNLFVKSQANKIKVIYNSALFARESEDTSKEKIVKNDGTFIVAMAARIVPQKGILEFCKIAKKTIEHTKNIEFWLAGPKVNKHSNYFEDIISQISSDASNRIKYIGELPSCKDFFQMADVVVNTSLFIEPFGLTLVEAMSLSKPLIAPPYGGPAEIVLNDETGWVIDPQNISNFSDAIIALSKNQEKVKAFGEAGYTRVQNLFSQQKFLNSFYSEYMKLIKK